MSAIVAVAAAAVLSIGALRRGSANKSRVNVKLHPRPIGTRFFRDRNHVTHLVARDGSNIDMEPVISVDEVPILYVRDLYSVDVGLSLSDEDWRIVEAAAAFIASLRFPLQVYRGLHLQEGKLVRVDRPGKHWTPVRDIAENFARWRHEGMGDLDPVHPFKPVILSTTLMPDDVDWRQTALTYLTWTGIPHEEASRNPMTAELQVTTTEPLPGEIKQEWI